MDMEMDMALPMKLLVKTAIKSPAVKAFTNLPFLLVLVLMYKMLQKDQDDINHAHLQHKMVQKVLAKYFLTKICSLDHLLVSLNNATFCMTLMAVKALDRKHLMLLVDCSWNGQSFSFVFPLKYHIQAQQFVEYLAKFLQYEHGDAVICWFTSDAIMEAKEMGWDEHLKHPISQDSINLRWISNAWILNGASQLRLQPSQT